MKKQLLYSFAAMVSFVLAGCSGDYDDWASPQRYSQEEAAAKYGITFAAGPDANVVMPTEENEIKIIEISAQNDDVSGYTVKSLSINGEQIEANTTGNYITVSALALNDLLVKENASRAAVKRDYQVKALVSINTKSGEAITFETEATINGSLTPKTTPTIDPNGYYLLGDFDGYGWNPEKPLWMEKVSDGIYEATVVTNAQENWFKFYEGSHVGSWDEANKGQMGCQVNGDKSAKNFIIWTGDDYDVQTPVIDGANKWKVTLDVNNWTYSYELAKEPRYFIIGNPNSWSTTDMTCMCYSLGNSKYNFTTKFTNQWDLKILEDQYFGLGDNSWQYCWGGVNGSTAATGSLVFGNDAGAIGPNENGGWYTFEFDMNAQTYKWTAVPTPTTYTSISLIGEFNSWSGDVDMTEVTKAPHNWYVRHTLANKSQLKFRANHLWDTSWGTAEENATIEQYSLPAGEKNIVVEAGTYDFYFNDITGNWNIVPVVIR